MDDELPLQSPQELLLESFGPDALKLRSLIPHPLFKFAANGGVKNNDYADAVLKWVKDITLCPAKSPESKIANWFLFESEMAFFYVCSEAGVDGEKLRAHLKHLRQLNPEEIDRLSEGETWTA